MKKTALSIVALFLTTMSFALPPIVGPTTLCMGSGGSYYDATPGGVWVSTNPSLLTIGSTSGMAFALIPGTDTITYTVGGVSDSLVITLYPPIAIYGSHTFCTDSTDTLTVGPPGGTFSSSDATIATVSPSGVITGVSPGTFFVIYIAPPPLTCSATFYATVDTCTPCAGLPDGGFSSADSSCSGYTLELTGNSSGTGITYQWQSSPDGSTWTNITGATAVPWSLFPSVSDFYRCKVSCTVSGLYAYSSSVYVPYVSGTHMFSTVIYTPDTLCNGLHLHSSTCSYSTTYSVATFYGDGTADTTAFSAGTVSFANIAHDYSAPGTYTIRQYFYNGASLIDSLNISFEYLYCHTLPVKFYFDANSDCAFDGGDVIITEPVLAEVDSNGVPVDTISACGGLYYESYGAPGTIYAFKVLSLPGGLVTSCPTSGIIYDTIVSGVNYYDIKYLGLNCGGPGFDLAGYASLTCGRHMSEGTLVVTSTSCTAELTTATMTFSPQYNFTSSVPAPTSVVGNVVTWYLGPVSVTTPQTIRWVLQVPGAWLIPGDTINSLFNITPTTGDTNPANNVISKTDTVKASWDPNYIEVNPAGIIPAGTQLEYTVHFENTGNDTAHNIYVMDTLSDDLLPGSLRMDVASAKMNIVQYRAGGHNIAKFDFPHINLLDSTHHGQCDGMFKYTIKSMSMLTAGTTILAHAGIYFDDNAVVLTDTAINIIGSTPILGGALLKGYTDVAIFPNPATDVLTIKTSYAAYNSFTITNQVGQVLLQNGLNGTQSNIDIKTLPAGLYYVTMKGDFGTKVMKFVKL